MKRLLMLAVACAGLYGLAGDAAAQTSRFKGWAAISKELSTRIAPKGEDLDLDRFLPAEDMEDLLGTWSTFGTEHSFQNGLPNSVSIAIWHATLSGFAKSIGASCTTPQLEFNERFLKTLQKLCAWPAADARTNAALLDYWWSIMGYNAPEQEYTAWRDYFLANYQTRPAAETVTAMTLAITMNPYFLLNK
jgi:hypothetical protein